MITRSVEQALGALLVAALEREDVRRASSVFEDEDEVVVVLIEHVSPAFDDVAFTIHPKDVEGLKREGREAWADRVLSKALGPSAGDDEEDQDGEDEDEEEDEDDEEAEPT